MAEKRYIEVIEAAQYADVFFADPLLKIATASLWATAPTANVVEVTRCKDCAQWGGWLLVTCAAGGARLLQV